jgi:hypothetical protein
MLTNEELLRKATLTTSDFGDSTAPLSVQNVAQFIELLSAGQSFLPDVRTVTSSAAKWVEGIVDFNGRITYPGTQGTRLPDEHRAKPTLGNVEISTVLLRAEVPISDETLEDNVAQDGFANSLENLIADQFGFDVEELLLNGDTGSTDPYLAQLDGWLQQAQGSGGHVVDASGDDQDYQEIFKKLLASIPNRHKRNLVTDGRFYVPIQLEEIYRDILSTRGTAYGDVMLTGNNELRYQGILIKGSASMIVDDDDETNILLTNRNNLYAGFRRSMTMETFRDPREGATSFVVTARVDGKLAIPDASAVATNVDVSI